MTTYDVWKCPRCGTENQEIGTKIVTHGSAPGTIVQRGAICGKCSGWRLLGRVLIKLVLYRDSLNVRFTPKATDLLRRRAMTRWAMYGRCPRCKRNLTFSEAFGCSHVYGLFRLEDYLCRDAAAVAAGPDVIR